MSKNSKKMFMRYTCTSCKAFTTHFSFTVDGVCVCVCVFIAKMNRTKQKVRTRALTMVYRPNARDQFIQLHVVFVQLLC